MNPFYKWFASSRVLQVQEYHDVVKRDFARNTTCFISFDVFWGVGMTFAMFQTAAMAYMAVLDSPKSIIGLIAVLSTITAPLQIVISHCFKARLRKNWLMMSYAAAVIPWLLYSIVFLAFPEIAGRTIQLVLFCICMFMFIGIISPNTPLQFALITDCTPLHRRGRLYGYRTLAQALGILAVSKLATMVMDHWGEPTNFLVAFTIGCTSYVICFCIILAVNEYRDPRTIAETADKLESESFFTTTIAVTKHILKSARYLKFLLCTALFYSSWLIGTLIIVYAKETLAMKGSGVVHFTVLQMISAAIFTLLLGKIADRVGYKIISVIMSLLSAVAFMFLLLAEIGVLSPEIGIYTGFILWAGLIGVYPMTMMNQVIELLPKQNSGILISMTNVLMMPVVLIATPLAGHVVDRTGSYAAIFTTAALVAGITAIGYFLLVPEPRKQTVK